MQQNQPTGKFKIVKNYPKHQNSKYPTSIPKILILLYIVTGMH